MTHRTPSVSRRTLVKGAASGAVMISLAGRPTRAQSGTEIVVSAQEFSHEPLQPFIEEFNAATGVTVTFFANPSAGGGCITVPR